jgi:hypothetical protein
MFLAPFMYCDVMTQEAIAFATKLAICTAMGCPWMALL